MTQLDERPLVRDAATRGENAAVRTPDHSAQRLRAAIIQAKMSVGPPVDRYEIEADAVADRVVRSMRSDNSAQSGVQRASPAIQRVQRSAHIGADGGVVDAETERAVRSTRGGGSPLPSDIRSRIEPAFGVDFGNIRVHAGSQATELNNRIQAKAFTTGNDIFFRDGLPDTSSAEGQHLLAHELTHTIQQGASEHDGAQRALVAQRLLDPAQTQQLDRARRDLADVLKTAKGSGKKKAKRKKRMDELRQLIAELEAADAEPPNTAEAVGASLISAPAVGAEEMVVSAAATTATPEPTTVAPQQVAESLTTPEVATVPSAVEPVAAESESVAQGDDVTEAAPETASADSSPAERPVVETVAKPEAVDQQQAPLAEDQETLEKKTTQLAGYKARDRASMNEGQIKQTDKRIATLTRQIAEIMAKPVPTILDTYPALQDSFDVDLVQRLHDCLGEAKFNLFIVKVKPPTLVKLFGAFSEDDAVMVLSGFPASAILSLTVEQLQAMATAWGTTAEVRTVFNDYGAKVVKEMFTKFTAAEFKKFVEISEAANPTLGAAKTLKSLINKKKLKATALKKYEAKFLSTFVGAGSRTIDHLTDIRLNRENEISGGHDKAIFESFLSREIEPAKLDPAGRVTTQRVLRGSSWHRSNGSDYEFVGYEVYKRDGSTLARGVKTLIPNLATKKAALMENVNNALWSAIAAETFNEKSTDKWQVTAPDGKTFEGYYRYPEKQLRTFFPTS